ncbi:MAG: ZIP family metal transporter [Lachnospiraceae bacterium]|jgi:ZIP family zinc transporter|nr:ZIP family metal transporter [Lachnospiraceae bacterium]
MQFIIFSAIAGLAGMGIGGFISALLLKKPSANIMCWMLSFAAGIMTGIVCFSLIPEAIHISGIWIVIVGLIVGIVVILLLNRFIDRIATERDQSDLTVHHTAAELYHSQPIIENREKLLRSGIIMFAVIAFHNFPEGIAIGVSGSHDFYLGASLALIIFFHNLPEGMAIAAPMVAGGMNRWKAVLITSLTGLPTLIGGILGVILGSISAIATSLSLAIAGGAMLYVVFGEIIPQTIVLTKNRIATIITLSGLIVGLLLTML